MDDTIKSQSTETLAEYLRLALPAMSRHGIPVTPHNYAVWFAHVSGEHAALSEDIRALETSGAPFDEATNQGLYQRHIAPCDTNQLDRVRSEMLEILRDVAGSVKKAGNDTADFQQVLDTASTQIEAVGDLRDLRSLLAALIGETRGLRESNKLLHAHFESRSREIELLHQELQRERKRAVTDPLTSLGNRLALMDQLETSIQDMPAGHPPALLMIDIDHFKKVNDNYGHLIGDRVIRFVAQIIKQNIRGRDVAARFGGEEFAVLLPETGRAGAHAVADNIRGAVANTQLIRSDTKTPLGQITVSAGVAVYRAGEDAMELVNRADQLMYRSKHNGRNRVTGEP